MDQSEQQNLQSLKLVTKLVLLVSLLSLVFSHYSVFLHSMKLYLSALFPLQLLGKNCIFLICNGILVFLAKTSGFLCSRSNFDLSDRILKRIVGDGIEREVLVDNVTPPVSVEEMQEQQEEEHEQEEEADTGASTSREGEEDIGCPFEEEEYKEEDRGIELLSTEELNKKFDEFIRKMKEEIRIEAQQQLVVV